MRTEHIQNLIKSYCEQIKDSEIRGEYEESLGLFIDYLQKANIDMITTVNMQQVIANYSMYLKLKELPPEEVQGHEIKLNAFITKFANIIFI